MRSLLRSWLPGVGQERAIASSLGKGKQWTADKETHRSRFHGGRQKRDDNGCSESPRYCFTELMDDMMDGEDPTKIRKRLVDPQSHAGVFNDLDLELI